LQKTAFEATNIQKIGYIFPISFESPQPQMPALSPLNRGCPKGGEFDMPDTAQPKKKKSLFYCGFTEKLYFCSTKYQSGAAFQTSER
jgi:hypothetical protein